MARLAAALWVVSSTRPPQVSADDVKGDAGSWVVCPPRDLMCVTRVKQEDPVAWTQMSGFDKSLAQRTFELLVVYDWEVAPRKQVTRANGIVEIARQLLCACTFARCDADLPARAIAAARSWAEEASSAGKALARTTFDACGIDEIAAHPAGSALGICIRAAVAWAEAEFVWAVKGFFDSTGVQPGQEMAHYNSRKFSSLVDYPALTYPSSLSPHGVCTMDGSKWPVFGGEAFGDASWSDVTNQRTRNLATMSVLELMENAEVFQGIHPSGPSLVAVNIGAFDGICRSGHSSDPANCLFATGYGGVLVEANRTLGPVLEESFRERQPHNTIVLEAALPETISDVLAAALAHRPGFPTKRTEVDLIKIDVDGADCELAAALVSAGWRPKVWHVEINPLFPYGVVARPRNIPAVGSNKLASAFSHHSGSSSNIEGTSTAAQHLTGCSLHALLEDLGPEYMLLQVEFENAVFVRQDLADALSPWIRAHDDMAKWRSGYFCHPLARVRMPYDEDEDSLFLLYDFRRWGDPSLSADELVSEVKDFLAYFSALESYEVHHVHGDLQKSQASGQICIPQDSSQERQSQSLLRPPPEQQFLQLKLDDPDCTAPWKGNVVSWEGIYTNAVRLLDTWTGGGVLLEGTDLEGMLAAFAEAIALTLNIDHAWTIFKAVARGECPLGGIIAVAVLRWQCGSHWGERDDTSHTNLILASMQLQLPMLYQPGEREPQPGFGRPATLGCEAVLDRYLESALRTIDFRTAVDSRWPVFELLSALHKKNHAWPRGYP